MLNKETANQAAKAIVDAKAIPGHKKRRQRLEQRYSLVFGKALANRCVDNADAAELAIQKAKNQWQVAVFMTLWLGVTALGMFYGQFLLAALCAILGAGMLRSVFAAYARRHFMALIATP